MWIGIRGVGNRTAEVALLVYCVAERSILLSFLIEGVMQAATRMRSTRLNPRACGGGDTWRVASSLTPAPSKLDTASRGIDVSLREDSTPCACWREGSNMLLDIGKEDGAD